MAELEIASEFEDRFADFAILSFGKARIRILPASMNMNLGSP